MTNNNGTPHSRIRACSPTANHTRHALTHTFWVIHSRTRSSLTQHHTRVTAMMFHSVHYCNNITILLKTLHHFLIIFHKPGHASLITHTHSNAHSPNHHSLDDATSGGARGTRCITGGSPVVESVFRPHRNDGDDSQW